MKHLSAFIFVLILFIGASLAVPVDNNKDTNKDAKSAFGPAFDEIVVESHLTVRRKSNERQGRTQNVTNEAGIVKTKREIKLPIEKKNNLRQIGASAANSQSQAFNSFGPLGNFGASASNSQSQTFGLGPNGLKFAAGFGGTQQYNFNGQTFDIAFGNAASGNGPVVTITGPDGKKRKF